MPSKSSGRISKPWRNKALPTHHKNHRWESFTTKISKLHSLDPLRRVRRHDLDAEDLSSTTSYFRNGLERWTDLNLSKSFLSFRREALPLSASLAQLLHFEDRIVDLLASYITLQDKDGLEPLLDLLTALAHDLGTRFEKHYPRALELIVAIASKPQPAEVIEWTFAALAFLFKYLSRFLVTDLLPTYDALASLLGRGRHPAHIARFAAEALSFLVKKAATPSHQRTALVPLIEHVRDDLLGAAGTKQFGLYNDGLMTMFAEGMKSSAYTLHSTAPDTYIALLCSIPDAELELGAPSPWIDLCCGTLTSVIHHSTADTFQPLASRLLEHLSTSSTVGLASVRLLGVLAGVRRGGRITDWSSVLDTLHRTLETIPDADQKPPTANSSLALWDKIVVNIAVVWIVAPLDAVISSLPDLTFAMSKEPLVRYFVPFCSYFAKLHPNRFCSLLQTTFQRFIATHWSEGSNGDLLCIMLPGIIAATGLSAPDKDHFSLPEAWQDSIADTFEQLEGTPFPEQGAYSRDTRMLIDGSLPKYSALLRILTTTAVQPSTSTRIAGLLLRKLKLALRPSSPVTTEEVNFIVGDGFDAYVRLSKAMGVVEESLDPLLHAAAPRFAQLQQFLTALLLYKQTLASQPKAGPARVTGTPRLGEKDPLLETLVANLSVSSHEIRLLSLQLLKLLETAPDEWLARDMMLQIETTPLEPQSIRAIGVQLRKLGQVYVRLEEGSWLQKAVPAFLFGMMTVKLSPVWDDAVEALKQVVQNQTGEDVVAELAFSWLDGPSQQQGRSLPTAAGGRTPGLTDFECRNLERLRALADNTARTIKDPIQIMREGFDQTQLVVPRIPPHARQKALTVLGALPNVAEKRSRKLVPFLLSWIRSSALSNELDGESDDNDDDDNNNNAEQSWSLTDRKLLIGIFAQFVNPKVLYQSEPVYNAILKLLENGDVQIQRLALKAILAWKQAAVKPYQENLEFLLDDARLKNEITVLFRGDNPVQSEHRPEVMPILLRLLYGRSIAKKKGGVRLAIIRNLDAEDLGAFLVIALGELADIRLIDASGLRESIITREVVPPRKQVGIMNMVDSIITELGTSSNTNVASLVHAVLYCAFHTGRRLQEAADEADETETNVQKSLLRDAKITALKCLCKLFQNAQAFDWTPYEVHIVSEIISPRIEKLAAETTQGLSGTWKLLETWSSLPKTALMLSLDARILPSILDCLAFEKTKPEVKISALGIVRNLIGLAQAPASESEFNEVIRADLLEPNIDLLLGQISTLLRRQLNNNRELLEAAVQTVVNAAPLVENPVHARNMVEISAFLLRQPSRNVPPKTKGAILLILEYFVVLGDLDGNADLRDMIRNTLSSLFSFFKDRRNRETLAKVFQLFATQDTSLQEMASLCVDLNSFVPGKLDVPDYDRRLLAFQTICGARETSFSAKQWMPLLHNLIFYLQKDEEFGILASNSADGLCKFIEAAESVWSTPDRAEFEDALTSVVLQALYAGAREPSETVRRETLRVFGHLISHLRTWAPVADLGQLCPSDEDSDKLFFFNILSPASSRQLQALHLLTTANERAPLGGKNISHFFIPLLEHFIFGQKRDGADDHGLGAQATGTIAGLASSLEWNQYRAILRRYISYVQSKPDLQKQVVRLLDKFVDVLSNAASPKATDVDESMDIGVSSRICRLTSTLPEKSKFADEITSSFLPVLLDHLHEKDESLVSARVPVGVLIVKLLKLLPSDAMVVRLPGVLTDISHILRSKAWESREMARDTLARIATVLGPQTFGFILRELRGALTRGSQLHVLSYTMHSLLLSVIPQFRPGELDYCVSAIVSIIMDDVFGMTGQEKDAEDYVSTMKEVKSSKSQDSMELIAKNASISSLVELVQPLKSLLMEKLDMRTMRKTDELLSRIAAGLLHNPAAESRDTLVFCYQVIQEVYKSDKPESTTKLDPKLKRYLIQKGAARGGERGTTTRHTYKLVRFAMDILRALMRKHDSLRNAANLVGFVPILGDAVVAVEDDVRNAAFKMLAVIAKVPFPAGDADDLYKVAAKEAVKAISSSPSTASDLAQSALKLISIVLRDRRATPIKDAAIDVLLARVKDDLTEPLYRHITFSFLRSVLDRKIETASVYDVLDHVGTVMITNDDKDTRDLARGAFFQFLRHYPQKKSRWAKQLSFVVANLKYDREGGRLSVMEVIHLLLMKSADDFVQEVAATCFLPLVFVLANDESEKCRLAAAELVRQVFRRAEGERLRKFVVLMRSWMAQEGNAAVVKLALETFALYFETRDDERSPKEEGKNLSLAVGKATEILIGDEEPQDADADLVTGALRLVHVLLAKFPAAVLSPETTELWTAARECLTHANPAVRFTAVKLLSAFLADFARPDAEEVAPGRDMVGSHGLVLTQDGVFGLARSGLGLLAMSDVNEALADETAKVLVFLGGRMPASATKDDNTNEGAEGSDKHDEEEDEHGAGGSSLQYLLQRLAAIIRKETPPKAQALIPKLAALDVLAALCSSTPKLALLPSVPSILRPLRNITDPSIPTPYSADEVFKTRHEAMKSKAQSIMDSLQQGLGTAKYTANLLAVSGDVKEKRLQRSSKRRVAAVVDPEMHGREKRKRLEKKKDRKKERGREERSRRQGY